MLALPALLTLGACAASVPPGGPRLAFVDATVPVASIQERKFQTVVRQAYDFSCGSAALATLLTFHYDDRHDEGRAFLGMWRDGDREAIRRLGFSLLDMKRYLASLGLSADGYRVSLDQIAGARTPGIALIDNRGYKHFVVVKGVDASQVLLGDPALGLRRVSRPEFARMWNGVFFVINDRPQVARASFGRAAEWDLAPSARATVFMRPLSEAALALTRPIPGEL